MLHRRLEICHTKEIDFHQVINKGIGIMKKKPTVAQLKKKADLYFSKYIRYRDATKKGGVYYAPCITCDKQLPIKQMHAGHFQSRRHNSTRYDDENVNAQCAACNTYNQGEQYRYAKALDLKFGDGTADKLVALAQEYHKLTIEELEGIIDESKSNIRHYEA